MWREAKRGYPKLIGDTRTPSGVGLGVYFSSPIKMRMNMRIPELYEFGFEEGELRPHPVAMPILD
jgi:hypothetical protein